MCSYDGVNVAAQLIVTPFDLLSRLTTSWFSAIYSFVTLSTDLRRGKGSVISTLYVILLLRVASLALCYPYSRLNNRAMKILLLRSTLPPKERYLCYGLPNSLNRSGRATQSFAKRGFISIVYGGEEKTPRRQRKPWHPLT
jgi:hypothetical protein